MRPPPPKKKGDRTSHPEAPTGLAGGITPFQDFTPPPPPTPGGIPPHPSQSAQASNHFTASPPIQQEEHKNGITSAPSYPIHSANLLRTPPPQTTAYEHNLSLKQAFKHRRRQLQIAIEKAIQ